MATTKKPAAKKTTRGGSKTKKAGAKGATTTSKKRKLTEVKTEGLTQTAEVRKTKSVKRAERPDSLTTQMPVVMPDDAIYAPDLEEEEYSTEEYEKMLGKIDFSIPLVQTAVSEDIDFGECSTGACPIK